MAHASVLSSYRHVNNSGLLESPPLFSTSCFLPVNRQILPIQQRHHLSSPNPTVLNKERQEEEDDDDQQQQQQRQQDHYDNDEEEEEEEEEGMAHRVSLQLFPLSSQLCVNAAR
jgi:hypothetical protein